MGQIRQNAEANPEIGLPLTDRALYSDKARPFNQSERELYQNFIIIRFMGTFIKNRILSHNKLKRVTECQKPKLLTRLCGVMCLQFIEMTIMVFHKPRLLTESLPIIKK